MTPEQRLAHLEEQIGEIFGCTTRLRNDYFEHEQQHGPATTEQKITLAEAVIRGGDRGVAGHMYEENRRKRLGRPEKLP
jgi:hypothetical protein